MVQMKTVTLRLTKEEREKIERVKKLGFSSVAEVIRCASISLSKAELHSRRETRKEDK